MRTGEIFDFMSGDANSIVEPRGKLLVEPGLSHVTQLWFYLETAVIYSLFFKVTLYSCL